MGKVPLEYFPGTSFSIPRHGVQGAVAQVLCCCCVCTVLCIERARGLRISGPQVSELARLLAGWDMFVETPFLGVMV